MLYKTLSAAVYGIDASVIEVEVDVSGIKMQEDEALQQNPKFWELIEAAKKEPLKR